MFDLPKDEDSRVAVLDYLRNAADVASAPRRAQWAINHYWMHGIRNLRVNYETGLVEGRYRNYKDESGQLRLVIEEIVVKFQSEMGRLMKMDLRPATKQRDHSLDGVRKAAAARVELDYLTAPVNNDTIKSEILYQCLMFGTCGVAPWVRGTTPPLSGGPLPDANAKESRLSMEVIPCFQLFPIPHNPKTPSHVEGILRSRWVPVTWLKRRVGLSIPRDSNRMDVQQAPFGMRPHDDDFTPSGQASSQFLYSPSPYGDVSKYKRESGKPLQTDIDVVRLEEYFFLHDDRDRLARRIIKAGRAILDDREFPDRSVYMPLGTCRYIPIGGFYGRSLIEILIPLSAENEQMAQNLFQNVKDVDVFGTTLLPQTWGISKQEILDRRQKRKVAFFQPNYVEGDIKPHVLGPMNLNDFPGKVLALGQQMLDRLVPQSDLLRGEVPGRIDSASALSFLAETSNIPLSVAAKGISGGVTQVYRAILAAAPELLEGRSDLPLLGLDDSILGLQIDPQGGSVKLDPSNFPLPTEVLVGVRDELPSPGAIREQKLWESLKRGIITPMEFRFLVWRESLDIPVGNWAEQESYRKAMLQCLFLFGDGENPGTVVPSAEADNQEIHLMVIQMFMSKLEYSYANIQVRQAFEQLKRTYQMMMGRRYPEQLPLPFEMADMTRRGSLPTAMGPGSPPSFGPTPGPSRRNGTGTGGAAGAGGATGATGARGMMGMVPGGRQPA